MEEREHIYRRDVDKDYESYTLRINDFDRTYVKLTWDKIGWVRLECYDRNNSLIRVDLGYSGEKGLLGYIEKIAKTIKATTEKPE